MKGGDPLFKTEFLRVEGADPDASEWSLKRREAFFFKSYEEADALATIWGGRPIFAVVCSRPAHRDKRAAEQLERRATLGRPKRDHRAQIEAEMRADDLAELERVEIYG